MKRKAGKHLFYGPGDNVQLALFQLIGRSIFEAVLMTLFTVCPMRSIMGDSRPQQIPKQQLDLPDPLKVCIPHFGSTYTGDTIAAASFGRTLLQYAKRAAWMMRLRQDLPCRTSHKSHEMPMNASHPFASRHKEPTSLAGRITPPKVLFSATAASHSMDASSHRVQTRPTDNLPKKFLTRHAWGSFPTALAWEIILSLNTVTEFLGASCQ